MKDWCDEEGAKRLREKIAAYWAERGYEVDVDLVDAGFEQEGKAQDERNLGCFGIDIARVALEASLAERLTVVGREDDQRIFAVSLLVQIGQQLPQH